ncbi:ATP-dependent DNA helicase RecQ family protein [Babesia bovis T2Bo]|uniref:DNA 3'-5' helicase n=1 Tax=Babesia bovis TaxID=5865 RepID=A7ASY0_BABBO|nr:ATP-dependent DNA helicase RecQ family protein [Babesia bovis T2Bo]EDO06041.1 ATP-dependent DNA helicase RecQ family protein [Babesia bovis T2Bo]|eukprot:XP_001609609.1 ATP-dependent DNA helicase, RecQ family protein [Babesia bovis T2Bo]
MSSWPKPEDSPILIDLTTSNDEADDPSTSSKPYIDGLPTTDASTTVSNAAQEDVSKLVQSNSIPRKRVVEDSFSVNDGNYSTIGAASKRLNVISQKSVIDDDMFSVSATDMPVPPLDSVPSDALDVNIKKDINEQSSVVNAESSPKHVRDYLKSSSVNDQDIMGASTSTSRLSDSVDYLLASRGVNNCMDQSIDDGMSLDGLIEPGDIAVNHTRDSGSVDMDKVCDMVSACNHMLALDSSLQHDPTPKSSMLTRSSKGVNTDFDQTCRCSDEYKPFIVAEAVSFFAVKHLVSLLRAVGECLSSPASAHDRWSHVVNIQKRAQMYVNEAVRSNFYGDELDQYRINLPLELPKGLYNDHSCQSVVGQKLFTSGSPGDGITTKKTFPDDLIPTKIEKQRNNGIDKLLSQERLAQSLDTNGTKRMAPKNGYTLDHSQRRKINSQSKYNSRFTGGSSPGGSEGCDSLCTETLPSQTMDSMADSSDTQGDGDISHLSDPLSDSRMAYMVRVNSHEVAGLDLRVPRCVLSENSDLFGDSFKFSARVEEINRTVFGYTSFRGVQLAAINAILLNRDCFVMMATGGGKSHCYQLPSMLLCGVVVVFSPLISLMEDQMRILRSYGIDAETVTANTSSGELRDIFEYYLSADHNFESGAILFITPEKFDKSITLVRLLGELHDAGRLKLFVIDEAHCVSQWGLAFRKDYRKLCNLKGKFPDVPILAMTATATPQVASDIIDVLRIPSCVRLRTTINRPNLWIECREKTSSYLKEMVEILKSTTGCGIVYTLTVGDSEKVSQALESAGISVGIYNAKLNLDSRRYIQQQWTSGAVRVMVATIAFGMGIDKPDVRFVFHTSAPVTILGYYQEIGRAGRDGKFSTTILWYNLRDFERHKNLGHSSSVSEAASGEHISSNLTLSNMREFCQNKSTCRRLLLFRAFGEDPSGVLDTNCGGCDNCCSNMLTEHVDVGDDARIIVSFVEEAMRHRKKSVLTMNILCDALRGSNKSTIIKYRLNENPYHGVLKHAKAQQICHIIQEMVNLRILRECRRKCMSFGRTVFVLGPNAQKLKCGNLDISVVCYKRSDDNPVEESDQTYTLHELLQSVDMPDDTLNIENSSDVDGSRSSDEYLSVGSSEPEGASDDDKAVADQGVETDQSSTKERSHLLTSGNRVLNFSGNHYTTLQDTPERLQKKICTATTKILSRYNKALEERNNEKKSDAGSHGSSGSVKITNDYHDPQGYDLDISFLPDDLFGSYPSTYEHGLSTKPAKVTKESGASSTNVGSCSTSTKNTWNEGSIRSRGMIMSAKDVDDTDIKAALHNNIRRKLPQNLVQSLS